MFESVHGGGLVFLRPIVSGSHLFAAGLPEEYTCADIPGDDSRTVSAFSASLVRQRIHVHVSLRRLFVVMVFLRPPPVSGSHLFDVLPEFMYADFCFQR